MKQSAAKTLGVAALGAAFAAAGAGAANAAPARRVLPDASQALGTVTQALPVENVTTGAAGRLRRPSPRGRARSAPAWPPPSPPPPNVARRGPDRPGRRSARRPPRRQDPPTPRASGVNGLPARRDPAA